MLLYHHHPADETMAGDVLNSYDRYGSVEKAGHAGEPLHRHLLLAT